MTRQFLKDSLGWGFILWLIGYIFGFVFFALVPKEAIGWYIMPFGIAITLWVLFKKISSDSLRYYLRIGIIWAVMAIVLDYLFIVKMLNSADYYKLDVYLYYSVTLLLPVIFGWFKTK